MPRSAWWLQQIGRGKMRLNLLVASLSILHLLLGFSLVASARNLGVALLAAFGFQVAKQMEARGRRIEGEWNRREALTDERSPFLALTSWTDPSLSTGLAAVNDQLKSDAEIEGVPHLQLLGEAVERTGRLLAIGAPPGGNIENAPKAVFLESDDTGWFDLFTAAAASCRAVLLIPGTTPGISREIEALRRLGLTDRVIVYMPPTPRPFPWITPFRYRDPGLYARRWSQVGEAWSRDGVRLPDYHPGGMLYRAASDLSAAVCVPLNSSDSPAVLAAAVGRLVEGMRHESQSLASITRSAAGPGGESSPAVPSRLREPARSPSARAPRSPGLPPGAAGPIFQRSE